MTGPGPRRPVVVLGDVMTDVVARLREGIALGSDAAADIEMCGGGSAANTAAWLAGCGVDVTLVGRIGADPAGRRQVAELASYGVTPRLAVDTDRRTGTCVVIVGPDGERTMLPDRGANLALSADDVPPELFSTRAHLHVSGYALLDPGPRDAARHAMTLARGSGQTISVDASSAAPLAAAGAGAFWEWTEESDLLLANADEASLLGDAISAYADVVVKLGADGAEWRRGGVVTRVPAAPATVLDTTGAGDAFAAGLLAAWLAGAEPDGALAAGAGLAARCVQRVGARPQARPARRWSGGGSRPNRG